MTAATMSTAGVIAREIERHSIPVAFSFQGLWAAIERAGRNPAERVTDGRRLDVAVLAELDSRCDWPEWTQGVTSIWETATGGRGEWWPAVLQSERGRLR